MDFVDECHSHFPRLAEKLLSKLKIIIFFFSERVGFPTHNRYFSLEKCEPKNRKKELAKNPVFRGTCN